MSEIKNGRYEANGTVSYYKDGLLHREDGPAFEGSSGRKEWLINGKHHREDGPAVEDSFHGDEWWFNDIQYPSQNEFPGDRVKIIKNELSTLNIEQLELLSDIVQQVISLRRSTEARNGSKPKV